MTRCEGCKKEFSGIQAFDAHRTGTFSPPTRRCFTSAEMEQRGFAQEVRRGKVIWYLVKSKESMSARKLQGKKPIPRKEAS